MIREIINYMVHLERESPQIFKENIKPSSGLHILIEFDDNGNVKNFPGEKEKDWDYYDGRNISNFIKNITFWDLYSSYITMNKQQKLDKKQKIHSASPFAFAFNFNFSKKDLDNLGLTINNKEKIKKKRVEFVLERVDDYFENCKKVFSINGDKKKLMEFFKSFIESNLNRFIEDNDEKLKEIKEVWNSLKLKDYIKFYIKNIDFKEFKKVYEDYLSKNIFNKNKYNLPYDNEEFGVIDFYTTFADKKPFLKHKTSFFKQEVSYRFTGKDANYLRLFEKLKQSKLFPNPLPIFIDKNEFRNLDEIIKIFKEDSKLSYSQIIKKLFEENPNRILQNYYLLFFSGLKIEDFDYIFKFKYSLYDNDEYLKIKNIFKLRKNKNILPDKEVGNIFYFENYIVKTIFNNSLVKIDENKNTYNVHYFGDIDPQYVSGGDIMYQIIMKYRKAFYDYIYKSKTETINSFMWDEIMWNSIVADIRNDKMTKEGYHTKEYSIKEKLNIWFSLYNYFKNFRNNRRIDMSSKIPELLKKIREVANDDSKHFESLEEFMFGAGQVIYFLLNQSKTAEKTHALLEPFLQKVKAGELQKSIGQIFNMYKHEISFGHGRFERLMKEVLGFETDENLKHYQRFLLAGYFSEPVIYEKSK